MTDIVVSAFYHFTRFDDPSALRGPLLSVLSAHDVLGTVLLAHEGVNGTLAGSRAGIDAAMDALRALPGCAALEHKESHADGMPFYRLKVRLKKEIVTLGVEGVDPVANVGTYVDPAEWNDLISNPDTIVIDTRNDYEVGIGTFAGAINPQTPTFRDFPKWFEAHRAELEGKKVAMFCTGGIRCEKSTSYLKGEGIEDVYHLKGGVLKYLEDMPETESLWQGDCFVFDQRVAVTHGLEIGEYELCHACRHPLNKQQRQSPSYVPGVSCEHCISERTDDQRHRYAARQAQMERAEVLGVAHVGAVFDDTPKKGAGGA
ncbi:MAG: rhodanese-related sulfurtransferase [Rhodospirillaceae bacterium]|nr:rhodanese-related sulfurtransferase [Rhodospirillaceae bacterium]